MVASAIPSFSHGERTLLYKNYLNYSCSKDRIYPIIRTYLEKAVGKSKKKILIDMFAGSGVVLFNSLDLFDTSIGIEKCKELVRIHNWIISYPLNDILEEIDKIIAEYGLSKNNKEGFLKLREIYNKQRVQGVINPAWLYCLITHAYNYQLHTNKAGEFNVPSGAGRSWFNPTLRQKLINMKNHISEEVQYVAGAPSRELMITGGDCMDFIHCLKYEGGFKDVVFYVDPPYSASISKHPYRVGNIKWTEDEDRKLFECLDYIHENKGKFIFSNVIRNNGVHNVPLQRWAGNYKLNPIEVQYTNCSYQRKNNGDTEEVIITNF